MYIMIFPRQCWHWRRRFLFLASWEIVKPSLEQQIKNAEHGD